jgi:hypothetical protein
MTVFSTIFSTVISLFTALKDYTAFGVTYYLGRSHLENKTLKETLKTEIKSKEEYLKNVEEVARMSTSSVFDELRSQYTRESSK